ncbi:MAG: DUF4440 domain-containing protein [Myxococcaceae bacterium]
MRRFTGWSAITLLVTVAAFAAGATGQKARSAQASDRQQVEAFASAFEKAWNQGQWSQLESLISENIAFANPSGQVQEGRDAMLKQVRQDNQTINDKNTEFRVDRVNTLAAGIVTADITHQYSKEVRLPNGRTTRSAQIFAVFAPEGDTVKLQQMRVFFPTPLPQVGVGGAADAGMPDQ